jgi:ABC-2 type transport system ATP-binding protein
LEKAGGVTMDAPIKTERLTKRFGRTTAVRELELEVPGGGVFALLGPNGAGKTTTIKLLAGILRASSGRAWLLGRPSEKLDPAVRARVGYVSESQKPPAWMTVAQMLDYCRPMYSTWDRAFERELVERMELPVSQKIRHLSRGQRMKAMLVSSLCYRPALLILDEPFSGLDPLTRDDLLGGLLEMSGQNEWTVFLSSHDVEDVERIADHVGFIHDGALTHSESLAALQARFRSVEISGATALPAPLPATWRHLETDGSTVRFIETAWSSRSEMELARIFPGSSIAVGAMSLREIFLAIAREKGSRR